MTWNVALSCVPHLVLTSLLVTAHSGPAALKSTLAHLMQWTDVCCARLALLARLHHGRNHASSVGGARTTPVDHIRSTSVICYEPLYKVLVYSQHPEDKVLSYAEPDMTLILEVPQST